MIFVDEKKYLIHSKSFGGNVYVRCLLEDRYKPQNIFGSVKFDGGGLNFWGGVSYFGLTDIIKIDGNLTGDKYCDILKNNLLPAIKEI